MERQNKLTRLFANTKLKASMDEYVIVGIPKEQADKVREKIKELDDSFNSVVFGEEQITIIAPEKNWKKIETSFYDFKIEKDWKLITLDIPLDWDVVGYLDVVTKLLAKENIGIGMVSSYFKDHILVKKADEDKAINILQDHIDDCVRIINKQKEE